MKHGDIRIPRLKFIDEHNKLLKVLSHPTKMNLKKEYTMQHKEVIKELHPKLTMEEIKEEMKKKRGKKDTDPFERKNKNKNKK